jgi:hypothetical protein
MALPFISCIEKISKLEALESDTVFCSKSFFIFVINSYVLFFSLQVSREQIVGA